MVPALSALSARANPHSLTSRNICPLATRVVLKGRIMSKARLLFGSTFLALAVLLSSGAKAQPAAHVLPKVAKVTVNSPVTLTDNGDSWTLDNGIVKSHRPQARRQSVVAGLSRRRDPDPRQVLGTDACWHHHRTGDDRPGDQRRRTRGGLRQGRQSAGRVWTVSSSRGL